MRTASEILEIAKRLPKFSEYFDMLAEKSEQVIIFGSYAAGVERHDSDIDILFVNDQKNVKTRRLDFICIKQERLNLKTWLGSELANHVAKYGIWVKGEDEWKQGVFISKNTLDRKKIMILNRLTHLYIKNRRLSDKAILELFRDVILDCFRLVHMAEGNAIPANRILADLFRNDHRNIMNEIVKEEYLGKVAEVYFNYLFKSVGYGVVENNIKNILM